MITFVVAILVVNALGTICERFGCDVVVSTPEEAAIHDGWHTKMGLYPLSLSLLPRRWLFSFVLDNSDSDFATSPSESGTPFRVPQRIDAGMCPLSRQLGMAPLTFLFFSSAIIGHSKGSRSAPNSPHSDGEGCWFSYATVKNGPLTVFFFFFLRKAQGLLLILLTRLAKP